MDSKAGWEHLKLVLLPAFVLSSSHQCVQSTLADCTESRRALVQQAYSAETAELPQHTGRQV